MKMKDNLTLLEILGVIVVILILGLIITHIYVLVKYGNTPVSEMPTWVWWWLKGNGSGFKICCNR
jgi:hypothetical protein